MRKKIISFVFVREALLQYDRDKISFSRFVEMLNEEADGQIEELLKNEVILNNALHEIAELSIMGGSSPHQEIAKQAYKKLRS